MVGSPVSVPRVAGAFVALHGIVFAVHGLWPMRALSDLVPSADTVGLTNPLLFIAVALCFRASAALATGDADQPRLRRLQLGCAGLLVVVAAAYLLASILLPQGPGTLMRSATQPRPLPFQLSPNAAVSYLLTGVAFLLFVRPFERWRTVAFVACAMAVGFIGLAGMIGHLLGLEALYRLPSFNRMLPPTALAFTVVGAGLWGLRGAVQEMPLRQIEGRIARRTLAVIVLVALSGAVAGFAVMRENFQNAVAKNLQLTATTTAASLAHTVQVALLLPRTVSTRPAVVQALETLAKDEDEAAARGVLQRVVANIGSEFDRIEVSSARGTLVAHSGSSLRGGFTVRHPLQGAAAPAVLGWADAYVLVSRHEVRQDGRLVGSIVTEQRLPLFDRLLADVRASDASSDAAICSREGERAACAPTRFRRETFTIPLHDASGQPAFPVVRAVLGATGVLAAKDLRGIDVISAHAPLGDLGLGLAVNTDVTTLYAPLRSQLALLAAAVLAIIALAIYALRSQVRPVVRRLAESERGLQESQERVQASERFMRGIADNVPALVSYIDRERRYTFANAQFGSRLGMDPKAMIGRTVRELRPEFHDTVLEPHLSAALQGEPRTFDGSMVIDGQALHFRHSYVPDVGPDGQLRGCYSLTVDVTAVREAERAAQHARRTADRVAGDLRLLFDAMPASLSLWSPEGVLLAFNQHFAALHATEQAPLQLGTTLESLLRSAVARGRVPEAQGREEAWIAARLRQFGNAGEPTTRVDPQGRWRRLLEVRLPDGRVLGHSVDVTELATAQAEAATARQRLNEAIEALPAGFELYDADDRLIIVNSTMKALYPLVADVFEEGLTFEQLVRANWQRGGLIVPDDDIERWIAGRKQQRRSGGSSRTQQLAGGRWVRSFDRTTQEGGVVGVRIDITELIERDRELARLNEELQQMADTDPLTLVANRRMFERRLADALAVARADGSSLALVVIDIDYFKRFNDRHGHPAGDSCLRRVAAVLKAALRGTQDLAARLGGEEFAMLLPQTDGDGAGAMVQRCMELLRDASIHHDDSPLGPFVTLSAGVAVLRRDETAEQLIARTDAALYEAKHSGRARWHMAA